MCTAIYKVNTYIHRVIELSNLKLGYCTFLNLKFHSFSMFCLLCNMEHESVYCFWYCIGGNPPYIETIADDY